MFSESRDSWLGRVSDAATALAATRNSECSDAGSKPSEAEIRYVRPSTAYASPGFQANINYQLCWAVWSRSYWRLA